MTPQRPSLLSRLTSKLFIAEAAQVIETLVYTPTTVPIVSSGLGSEDGKSSVLSTTERNRNEEILLFVPQLMRRAHYIGTQGDSLHRQQSMEVLL